MNFDFVLSKQGVRVLFKPRPIFSRINGPNNVVTVDVELTVTLHTLCTIYALFFFFEASHGLVNYLRII